MAWGPSLAQGSHHPLAQPWRAGGGNGLEHPEVPGRGQAVPLSLQHLPPCDPLFRFGTFQISQASVPAHQQGPPSTPAPPQGPFLRANKKQIFSKKLKNRRSSALQNSSVHSIKSSLETKPTKKTRPSPAPRPPGHCCESWAQRRVWACDARAGGGPQDSLLSVLTPSPVSTKGLEAVFLAQLHQGLRSCISGTAALPAAAGLGQI